MTVANGRGEIAGAVTTGADGSYRLSQLAEGQYTLVVAAAAVRAARGAGDAVEEGELVQHDVELPASGAVAGTVLTADGTQPFPAAQVTLTNEVGTEVASAAADADGRFTLSDVPSGRYTLVASGYRPGVAALAASNGAPGRRTLRSRGRGAPPGPSGTPTARISRRSDRPAPGCATWRYPPSEGHVNRYVTAPAYR